MGKTYNNAITTTAGFNYAAQQPLDDRAVVDNYSDLAGLISSGVSYEGMEVYVVANKKAYKLIGNDWKAVATDIDIGTMSENIAAVAGALDSLLSSGTTDPDENITSQFYFKYTTE
jgi:hypothetical protein